jgi:hypothetical protein
VVVELELVEELDVDVLVELETVPEITVVVVPTGFTRS